MNFRVLSVLALAAVLMLGACEDESNKPYLSIVGGGFIFNYRIGEAFYGFVAKPERSLPEGASIEATFENPQGGSPLVVSQPVRQGQLQYTFKSPPVKDVKAERDYKVTVRLFDPKSGELYASYERSYRTQLAQAQLPDKPLVVGPAYQPNPEVDPWHLVPEQKP